VMVSHVLTQAKRVFGVPDFKYYAISDGLANIFKRSTGPNNNSRTMEKDQPPDQLKLAL
jgi:hypothetical protein